MRPEARLMDSMLGALRTQVLHTALELGIAELLAERPRTAADLAEACGCDPTAMRRLLAVLAADGVLAESPEPLESPGPPESLQPPRGREAPATGREAPEVREGLAGPESPGSPGAPETSGIAGLPGTSGVSGTSEIPGAPGASEASGVARSFGSPEATYALTDVGRCLRPSAQGGMGEYVEFICTVAAPAAGHLTEAIREGRGGAAFETAAGRPFFRHLAENPDAGEQFDTAMHVSLGGLRDGVLSRDWQGVRTVADIGGGKGGLLAELLRARPQLTGTLCELPHVLAAARPLLSAAGVAERCALTPCDFFTQVPSGLDVYLLIRVLHDWDDASAARILGSVRAAMRPDSRLYVADLLLPDSAEEDGASWRRSYDLWMNLLIPGHERTAGEWRELLAGSGFRIVRTTDAGWRASLLECAPQPVPTPGAGAGAGTGAGPYAGMGSYAGMGTGPYAGTGAAVGAAYGSEPPVEPGHPGPSVGPAHPDPAETEAVEPHPGAVESGPRPLPCDATGPHI